MSLVKAILVVLVSVHSAKAQPTSPGQIWEAVENVPQRQDASLRARPEKSRAFQVNHGALQSALASIPKEFSKTARIAPSELSLPMPDGKFARFSIVESLVMEPELAAKFPEIKTYLGQGIDDPAATVRFSVTPAGFHGQILSPKGAVYIDPFERGNADLHTSFFKSDYQKAADGFRCLVQEAEGINAPALARTDLARSGGNLRTYRLAMAATGEYVAFHGGTVNAAMAAIVTAVNRITGIYEVELAVRLVLVANNDLIVYTDAATDPYSNTSGSSQLSANQINLDQEIGSSNYDIGHLLTSTGGGLASLGVVCENGWKARGVTGSSSPTGDSFYVDYIAHEIGHQFGGNHTFNSELSSCDGGRYSSTAYEPGSGSTIQAYAGICGSDNLQSHSDSYFHSISFDEILGYITGAGNGCAVLTSTGNTAPTVSAGPNFVIPQSTPFTLTATGSDPNGDALTYCWEQRNLGPAQTLSASDNGSSPLFRSFSPTSDPSRTFPRLENILNNTASIGEKLPTASRTMNFRVTARDNRAGGGGVNTANMTVTVNAAAGPFIVTSPNSAVSWSGARTVTWNVAGTSGGTINAANVDILLSTNGGNSFPVVLASNTPNDGSENIVLPDVTSSTARIKIEAVGNIFFDISDANFSISPALVATPLVTLDSAILLSENCAPTNNKVDPGETVTFNFELKNVGTANTTNLVATLLAGNGVVSPSGPQTYGALIAGGATVGKTFSCTANGSCGETIQLVLQLQDGTANLGTLTHTLNLGTTGSATVTETNTTSITTITEFYTSLYPSTILISDVTGTVSKVTVSLFGLSHEYPDDLGVLLAGPNGETVLLMSDAGGFWSIADVNLTFDSSASTSLPDEDALSSGTYHPGNFFGFDDFHAPAPPPPYGASLENIEGISPNGVWSLYIVDRYAGDDGALSGGWKLEITTIGTPDCCTDNTPPTAYSVTRSGNEVTLSWNAIPDRTYRVQYNDNLTSGNWIDIAGDVIATATTATKIDVAATDSQRFYRIILLP